MASLLAVDPGGTTGLAWADSLVLVGGAMDERTKGLMGTGEITGDIADQGWKLHKGIVRLDVRVIVSESSDHFVLAPMGKGRLTKHSLVPVKLAGIISFIARAENEHTQPLVHYEQTPSQAKSVVKDAVLNEMGFQTSGRGRLSPHELDALRHLILLIRRYRESKRKGDGWHEAIDAALSTERSFR
jgi:hypothetical protein